MLPAAVEELGRNPSIEWKARRRGDASPKAAWLVGPAHDVALALVWVPFAVAAQFVATDPQRLPWLVSATLLFSFAHQPLTLWLAYGDASQRRTHARLLVWAPLLAVLAASIGPVLQPVGVAVVAGAWNTWHTLRQRYGISRLCGRAAGIDCGSDNRLLWSWLAVSVLVAASGPRALDLAAGADLGARNESAVHALTTVAAASGMLLPAAIVIAVAVSVAWVRTEVTRQRHGAGRLVYLASTAALLLTLAVAPIVGFVAYVGGHAAEYFFMVWWRVSRAAQRRVAGDSVGAVGRRIGSVGTLALYAVAVFVLIAGVGAVGDGVATTTIVLTLGVLHLLYDGIVWRSPKQATPP